MDKRICERHGEYEARRINFHGAILWSRCPKCEIEISAKIDADKQKAKRKRHLQLLQESGVPPRFYEATFDTYRAENPEQQKVLKICRAYTAGFDQALKTGRALVLCGSLGTGKTHLGLASARVVGCDLLYRSYYSTAMQMIRAIREAYGPTAKQTEQQLINRFVSYDLLVLDELGVQLGTESERLLLFEVLDGRYLQLKPTMLISNLNLQDLTKYLGERILDRLREGGGQVLNLTWDSYRRRKNTA